jgi:predicted dehydrogenase
VVARSEETQERAREGGAASVMPSVEALPQVDGIVVVTPTITHADVAWRALERGVPVYVEKPITADTISAERLVERANGRLFVMDKWRYHRGVEALRDLARSGELGPVRGIRSTRVGWTSHRKDVDAAYHLMPHDLAIAREILGFLPSPRAAVAEPGPEGCDGLLGVLGQGEESWVVAEVSARRRRHFREVRVFFRDGTAVLEDSYAGSLAVTRGSDANGAKPPQPERRPIPHAHDMPLQRELAAFLGHLRGGPPPKSSAEEGLETVRAIAALRRLAGL